MACMPLWVTIDGYMGSLLCTAPASILGGSENISGRVCYNQFTVAVGHTSGPHAGGGVGLVALSIRPSYCQRTARRQRHYVRHGLRRIGHNARGISK